MARVRLLYARLLFASCSYRIGDMLVVPLHGLSDSSIIAVVDGFTLVTGNVSFLSELVEEDIKAFPLVLRQGDQPVVQW